jgi:hypothetical protein
MKVVSKVYQILVRFACYGMPVGVFIRLYIDVVSTATVSLYRM